MAHPQPAPDDDGDRRGHALLYVSYWSHLRRQTRREVFTLREQGYGVAAITRELGLSRHEVEAILLTDRRRGR